MRARLDQALVKNGGVTHSAKRSAQREQGNVTDNVTGKPLAFFHGLSFTEPEADEEERASLERAIKAAAFRQKGWIYIKERTRSGKRVGSLTRLMVKTYNDNSAAKGSGRCIKFTDFGDDATNNMMLIYEPPVRKQKA